MRRAAALVALVLLAAGCEDSTQASARHAVERAARAGAQVGCTSGQTGHFGGGPAATVFVCVAHVGGGVCDRYVARRRAGDRFTVRLQARRADCTLPAS
jgi:hypothetical protein